jgi:hypothetical protein
MPVKTMNIPAKIKTTLNPIAPAFVIIGFLDSSSEFLFRQRIASGTWLRIDDDAFEI